VFPVRYELYLYILVLFRGHSVFKGLTVIIYNAALLFDTLSRPITGNAADVVNNLMNETWGTGGLLVSIDTWTSMDRTDV
jgi:hypothetical protein